MRRKSGVSTSIVVLRAALADRADGVGEMLRAAVGEIVAIDRRDNDVRKAELGGCLADTRRFIRIERTRHAGLDVAEGAGARASVAQDHEGRVLLLPALADIRAAGFLAHGDRPLSRMIFCVAK